MNYPLVFLQVFQIFINICFALTADFVFPEQLFEGSECLVNANNVNGTCKEFLKCPKILSEIEKGLRGFDFQDHCSIYGSKELVCCPFSNSGEFGLRPSDVAKASQQIKDESQNLKSAFENEEALEGELPFMVSLGYRDNRSNNVNYKCGGSLITSLYVLTAAHCLTNVNNDIPTEVRLGFSNQRISTKSVQRISIANLYPHPNYNPYAHYYDIALVKLEKPVEITATVKPIYLHIKPITSASAANGNLFTAGFNLARAGNNNSGKVLKSFNLTLVDKSVCAKSFSGLGALPFGLDESMKCGKDINDKRGYDVCEGDSGGPLFLRNENTFSLVGVISFGIGCTGLIPTVYVSIYHFLDWIETQVRSP